MGATDDRRPSGRLWARRAIYWLAVLAVSIVVVALLLQVIHALDGSTLGS